MTAGPNQQKLKIERQIAFRALLRATFVLPAPGRESEIMSGYVTRYLRALITTAALIHSPKDSELIKLLEKAQFEIDERDQTITDIFREDEFYYPGDDISHELQNTFLYWSFQFETPNTHDVVPVFDNIEDALEAAKKTEAPKGITKYLKNFTQLDSNHADMNPSSNLWTSPLMSILASDIERNSETHQVLEEKLVELLRLEKTSFWLAWFKGFLNGSPIDLKLQEEIARIPDSVWKLGAGHVARSIKEAHSRFELEQQIAKLKEENARLSERSRFEIGANGGPELEETKRVVQEVIWAPIEAIEAETQKDKPDTGVICKALDKLKQGVGWLLTKSAENSLTFGMGWYFSDPAKAKAALQSIITASERWLQALINLVG